MAVLVGAASSTVLPASRSSAGRARRRPKRVAWRWQNRILVSAPGAARRFPDLLGHEIQQITFEASQLPERLVCAHVQRDLRPVLGEHFDLNPAPMVFCRAARWQKSRCSPLAHVVTALDLVAHDPPGRGLLQNLSVDQLDVVANRRISTEELLAQLDVRGFRRLEHRIAKFDKTAGHYSRIVFTSVSFRCCLTIPPGDTGLEQDIVTHIPIARTRNGACCRAATFTPIPAA
jgi:hypothetical protein